MAKYVKIVDLLRLPKLRVIVRNQRVNVQIKTYVKMEPVSF